MLVDAAGAGAGMDGIYSAARELEESALFREAVRLTANLVTRVRTREDRLLAERAVRRARAFGRHSVAPWTELDFLARIVDQRCFPGELFHLLGLWPVGAMGSASMSFQIHDIVIYIRGRLRLSLAALRKS